MLFGFALTLEEISYGFDEGSYFHKTKKYPLFKLFL
jgi:hypothetical protein